MSVAYKKYYAGSPEVFVKHSGHLLNRIAHNAGGAIHSVGRKIREVYPSVSAYAHDVSGQAIEKVRRYTPSSQELRGWADHTVVYLRKSESRLIKVGLVYLAYKWFCSTSDATSSKAERVQTHIQQKPIESAAIALGVGYLIGKLLR